MQEVINCLQEKCLEKIFKSTKKLRKVRRPLNKATIVRMTKLDKLMTRVVVVVIVVVLLRVVVVLLVVLDVELVVVVVVVVDVVLVVVLARAAFTHEAAKGTAERETYVGRRRAL